MPKEKLIGIDLGATNIGGGLVHGGNIESMSTRRVNSQGSAEAVRWPKHPMIFISSPSVEKNGDQLLEGGPDVKMFP